MPKTAFSTDNVKSGAPTFPKVKLQNKGDVWRIVCVEENPTYEWVHQLRKPKISQVTGEPLMVTKERRNGEKFQDYDMEFVGNPMCLGDPDVLDEKGVDADHCPVCERSAKGDIFPAPERKFAIHVLKYATKNNTTQIASPFSVECLVWTLSEGRFAKVVQIISEWGGDARKVDLILGPCKNPGFQNYEIAAGSQCVLMSSKEYLERGVATYQENHASDLSAMCGRKTDRRYVVQDIEDIEARWAAIRRGGETPSEIDTSETLDSSLLDQQSSPPPSAAPAAAPVAADSADVSGIDEFMPGTTSNPEAAADAPASDAPASDAPAPDAPAPDAPPADPAPVPDPAPSASGSSGGDQSFEQLLSQLG